MDGNEEELMYIETYRSLKRNVSPKTIMDFIEEDPTLTQKITYEEAEEMGLV